MYACLCALLQSYFSYSSMPFYPFRMRRVRPQLVYEYGLPGGSAACQCMRHKRQRFNAWVRKTTQNRKSQRTPVFLPEKFPGQSSPAGYSPWGHKELDTLSVHACTVYLPSLNLFFFFLNFKKMGGRFKREGTYVYLWLIHVEV